MRRFRTCARAKENYDYKAPMTSSLSDCTWLEKEWKFHLSTTWHPSLHFIFLFFHLIHPSHIFIPTSSFLVFFFFFILSFTYIFFFLSFFLSFPYSYFPLYFSLSWQLFKALSSSLSRMHTIWNFNLTMLETRQNFKNRLCSRNAMHRRDV
jgi:hypothetical protein